MNRHSFYAADNTTRQGENTRPPRKSASPQLFLFAGGAAQARLELAQVVPADVGDQGDAEAAARPADDVEAAAGGLRARPGRGVGVDQHGDGVEPALVDERGRLVALEDGERAAAQLELAVADEADRRGEAALGGEPRLYGVRVVGLDGGPARRADDPQVVVDGLV